MTATTNTHLLIGYADPAGQELGFLLPVFSRPMRNALQVEIWGPGLTVGGFADTAFDGPMAARPKEEIWSQIGGPAHWAFIIAGEIVYGAGTEGQEALAAHLDAGDLDRHPLLALEVAEFLKRPAERLQRAAAAYASLRRRSEAGAARWRDLSILTPDFRNRLVETFEAQLLNQITLTPGRVTASVQNDVVEVAGIDIKQHPMRAQPVVDALQSTMNALVPLYGRKRWKFVFRGTKVTNPSPWEGHDLDRLDALVYVADTNTRRQRMRDTRSVVDGIGLYGPSDAEVFTSQALGFRGPSFALYSLDRSKPIRLPHAKPGLFIGVATRVKATARLYYGEHAALQASNFQTIIVPSREQAAWLPNAGLAGELRDAINFMSAPSLKMSRRIRAKHYVFVRASGSGPAPYDDAWAQLYGRLWKLGMIEAHGFRYNSMDPDKPVGPSLNRGRALPPTRYPQELGLSEQLFPQMEEISADVSIGDKRLAGFDVAILAEATEISEDDVVRRHADVVDAVLHMQGWLPIRPSERYGQPGRRYLGGHGEVEIAFPVRRIGAGNFIHPHAPEIGAIQEPLRILAHEEAGPSAVLACLQERGAVLATLRDLSYFPARIGGVWPLLASQMRRFCSSLPARSRSEYFAMFVRTAIRTNHVSAPKSLANDIANALATPMFGHHVHLSCSTVRYEEAEAIATMRLAPYGAASGPTYRFQLAIRPEGPLLLSYPESMNKERHR